MDALIANGWAETARIAKPLTRDLGRLNALEEGLGKRAVAFVLGPGGDTAVLATLAALAREAGETLKVAANRGRDQQNGARRQLMLFEPGLTDEMRSRYAQIIATVDLAAGSRLAGTDAVPMAVRKILSDMLTDYDREAHEAQRRKAAGLTGRRKVRSADDEALAPVGPEALLTAIQGVGGTAVDLLDVLYGPSENWTRDAASYRADADMDFFLRKNAVAVAGAVQRLSAVDAAELLKDAGLLGLDAPEVIDAAVTAAAAGSRKLREAAIGVMARLPSAQAEALAIEGLAHGGAKLRESMVAVLGTLATDPATAALRAHLEAGEKSAIVAAAIRGWLDAPGDSGTGADMGAETTANGPGYIAVDGSFIAIPPLKPLDFGPNPQEDAAIRTRFEQEVQRVNAWRAEARVKHKGQRFLNSIDPLPASYASELLDWLAAPNLEARSSREISEIWDIVVLGKRVEHLLVETMPPARALRAACALLRSRIRSDWLCSDWIPDALADLRDGWLQSPEGDMRHIDAMACSLRMEHAYGTWDAPRRRHAQPGDLLRSFMDGDETLRQTPPEAMPASALWPYVAERLDVIDEALGLSAQPVQRLGRTAAVRSLAVLPKTPQRYVGVLLQMAVGEAKGGRAEARALLADLPDLEARLITLLSDGHQAVRAGAAAWLGARDEVGAISHIVARLKKEKSDLARATMLDALARLGGPVDDFVGPTALTAEAKAGLKKARLEKLDWLDLDAQPQLAWADGTAVDPDVVRWWAALGVKLKEPGGNRLFELYLDRLDRDSAAKLSSWVLTAWIAYDTVRPDEATVNQQAEAYLRRWWSHMKRYFESEEEYRALLRREFASAYVNSGAATKGLLALAARVPAGSASVMVQRYLTDHGARTSQASSLLEVMAVNGEPAALQVIVAAATRLRQKSVQDHAGRLVAAIAEARGWTADELADRTVPSAGLEDDGTMSLPVGRAGRIYTARLADDLSVTLENADGKAVKTLPTGDDDATKASKKALSDTKRALKQITKFQAHRLYEALCAGRSWTTEAWARDVLSHPVMRRLAQRVVWLGLHGDGHAIGAFRPTAEGDLTDAADGPVALDGFMRVAIAHAALLDDPEAANDWARHFEDYEIVPLMAQFDRPLLSLPKAMTGEAIEDRMGWVSDAFAIRGAATKLGYARGEAIDGGWFDTYRKSFPSIGLDSVIAFTGNTLPEENVPVALVSLAFERQKRGGRVAAVALSEVPPVLLSEAWCDYHAMAANAVFDAEWRKKCEW